MTDLTYAFLQLLIMALVTYLVRMLPMVLLNKPIQNRWIRSFLYYVPYAVLGSMTFPAIFFSTGGLISGLVGTAVGMVLAFCKKSLITVAIAACAAVYVTNLLLALI